MPDENLDATSDSSLEQEMPLIGATPLSMQHLRIARD